MLVAPLLEWRESVYQYLIIAHFQWRSALRVLVVFCAGIEFVCPKSLAMCSEFRFRGNASWRCGAKERGIKLECETNRRLEKRILSFIYAFESMRL